MVRIEIKRYTHAACVQGVDGAQKATQATSHADMRLTTATRPDIGLRRVVGRAAVGATTSDMESAAQVAPYGDARRWL